MRYKGDGNEVQGDVKILKTGCTKENEKSDKRVTKEMKMNYDRITTEVQRRYKDVSKEVQRR